MNRRNIALTALVLAALLTGVFAIFETVNRNAALGIFYFPAIVLAVILSGFSRSPSEVAAWSSFIVYTVFYWLLFLVLYAILLEYYLLTKSAPHLRRTRHLLATEGLVRAPQHVSAGPALEGIGQAVREVETRRRGHFLLGSIPAVDLSEDERHLGARALVSLGNYRPVKGVLRRFRRELEQELGKTEAARFLQGLHEEARRIADPDTRSTGPA
jgi:hypothetical protein